MAEPKRLAGVRSRDRHYGNAELRSRFDPPRWAILRAIGKANESPCVKSKRGVVVWRPYPDDPEDGSFEVQANNSPPPGFRCDGSSACRAACGKLCEHAEAKALRLLGRDRGLEMLHVKTVDGELVPSGSPSCWQCSKAILADGRIWGVWLYHEDGWRRYTPDEFHRLTLEHCGLPVIEVPGG